MKKTVRLTEADLIRLVKRVVNEQKENKEKVMTYLQFYDKYHDAKKELYSQMKRAGYIGDGVTFKDFIGSSRDIKAEYELRKRDNYLDKYIDGLYELADIVSDI